MRTGGQPCSAIEIRHLLEAGVELLVSEWQWSWFDLQERDAIVQSRCSGNRHCLIDDAGFDVDSDHFGWPELARNEQRAPAGAATEVEYALVAQVETVDH